MARNQVAGLALLLLVAWGVISTIGCENGPDVVGDHGSGSDDGGPPPNPIANRVNPLQEYIRTHWTGGDPASTAGYHRGHIKVYGHNNINQSRLSDGEEQARFIADHFDMYTWGGWIVGEYMNAEESLWLFESTNVPIIRGGGDSSGVDEWLGDPGKNTAGYTWDDLVMHYKWDVDTWGGAAPGWNPKDDLDRDLCRERPPSDPGRTAQCIQDAEARYPEDADSYARFAKATHPGYTSMMADRTVDRWRERGGNGFHYDCVAYENMSLALDKTFAYDGGDESDYGFQMRGDLLAFVPSVAVKMEKQTQEPLIHLANLVSPYYTCTIPEAKILGLEYIENTFNECWIVTNNTRTRPKPMSMQRRGDYLDCPFLDWLEQGKGYVFTCHDPAGSDRGKRFSLAAFYMINHQMAFYYYRAGGHSIAEGEHVADKQWNPYVEFDVGQPAVNSLGLADFQDRNSSDRYFVWESAERYEIVGREYLRSDGKRVLVLVKLMHKDEAEGGNPTTHQLSGDYGIVQSDLTLSGPVTEVTLFNNDGVILVEQSP
jgi:hypothetical protein